MNKEIRSNDKNTKLVVYNVDGQYDCIRVLIDSLIEKGFNKPSIYDYFEVASSLEELKAIVDDLKQVRHIN